IIIFSFKFASQEECPLRGRYTSRTCQHPLLFLGCQKPNEIQIATECSPAQKGVDLYSCAAHFELDDDHYLLVRDELSMQYQCLNGASLHSWLDFFIIREFQ
ncbi:hypothetical protein GCK32_011935, partial [Trichostrongylus colubriformis]